MPKSFADLDEESQRKIRAEFHEFVHQRTPEAEVEAFREHVAKASFHPPAPLVAAKARVVERVHRDARRRNVGETTGSHDVDKLMDLAKESVERQAAETIREKQEELLRVRAELERVRAAYEAELKADKVERKVEKEERKELLSRREKWLLTTLGAILLAVSSSLITKWVGVAPAPSPVHAEP